MNNNMGPAGRENTNHNEDVDRQVGQKVHYGRPQLPVGGVGKVTVVPNANGFQAHASTRDASGARKRIKASASTAEEAERLVRSKAAGLAFVPGELTGASTLGELLDVWLAEVVASRNIRPQTMQMYRTKVNRLQRDFGAIELADLRPRRMQIVVNDLARRMKASEFQTLRGIMRQAFRYAVRAELVTANPLDAIESVRPAEQGPPIALTVEQVQVFRREFAAYVFEGRRDSNRHKAQLVVDIILGLGGLRISEALALRHSDVDFEKNTANINGTLVYIARKPLQRQSKLKRNGQSRIVRLARDGIGMRALRAAREQCASNEREPEMPLVRRVETGGVVEHWINPAVISLHFDRVTNRQAVVDSLATTGLTPELLTPHTLRRSVATVVTRGASLEQASELLGHSDTRITKRSYVAPEERNVSADAVDELFGFDQPLIT